MKAYAQESTGISLELGEVAEPASLRVRLAQQLLQGRGWTLLHVALDVLLLGLAVAAAWLGAPDSVNPEGGEVLMLLFPPVTLGLFALRGLYRGDLQVRIYDDVGTVVAATSLAAAGLMAAATFVEPG